jgi:hypothetical protein
MNIPETLDKSTVNQLLLSHGTWKHLFYRCYSKVSPDYKNYGGRGIDVHPSWHGDDGFYQFIKDVGLRPSKDYSLDRIDVNKGYSPENVKWSTSIEQANNRRNSKRYLFEGENLTLAEIARKTGIGYQRIWKATKIYGDPSEHIKIDPDRGKRMYQGELRSTTEIAKMVNMKPETLMQRLRNGLDFDLAIALPPQPGVHFTGRSSWS